MEEMNESKRHILETSLILFSEKGYEGASVSLLTKAAGITKPTLYYYFGNKEGLFEAVCREQYARLNAVAKNNCAYVPNPANYSEDVYKTLSNLAFAYIRFAVENEVFYRIVMANMCLPRSSPVFGVAERFHYEQYGVIGGMFREMARAHGNLKGKEEQLCWSFIGEINTYISLKYSGIIAEEPERLAAERLVHRFMHGIYA